MKWCSRLLEISMLFLNAFDFYIREGVPAYCMMKGIFFLHLLFGQNGCFLWVIGVVLAEPIEHTLNFSYGFGWFGQLQPDSKCRLGFDCTQPSLFAFAICHKIQVTPSWAWKILISHSICVFFIIHRTCWKLIWDVLRIFRLPSPSFSQFTAH